MCAKNGGKITENVQNKFDILDSYSMEAYFYPGKHDQRCLKIKCC